jgi:uncharacterized protein YndB with AHSA1/START domain
MPHTFTLNVTIPATPGEIYQAWLDSLAHSEMTGGEASMSDQLGAEVSAWDGYISGRNLVLIPSERIVQSWRTSEFGDEHEDSVITVLLEQAGDDTVLTLEHSNVPDEHRSYEEGGWQSNYFEPMVAYFGERRGKAAEPARRGPAKSGAPKAAPKTAAEPRAKSAGRAKRAASAKNNKRAASAKYNKRAASAKKSKPASRTKAPPKKNEAKSKGKARASVRSRAKLGPRKSSRGKRS